MVFEGKIITVIALNLFAFLYHSYYYLKIMKDVIEETICSGIVFRKGPIKVIIREYWVHTRPVKMGL